MRTVVVLRPEPGNAATLARLSAAGLRGVSLPLFAVTPLRWTAPDAHAFDALLLTSAQAPRHAGPMLDALAALPVVAVGEATAAAARARGLSVVLTGDADAAAVAAAARARGWTRLLHLGGRDRATIDGAVAIACYASETVVLPTGATRVAEDAVVLLHSARAAARWAALATRDGLDRARACVAALSVPVAEAAGEGWERVVVATTPDDAALVAVARSLAIDPPAAPTDKRGR